MQKRDASRQTVSIVRAQTVDERQGNTRRRCPQCSEAGDIEQDWACRRVLAWPLLGPGPVELTVSEDKFAGSVGAPNTVRSPRYIKDTEVPHP